MVRNGAKAAIRRLGLGTFGDRVRIGATVRPGYAYCTYFAADLAKRLGKERVTVLELGVAGGNGLVQLEKHASEAERALSIKIDVVGFDTGHGLPKPTDFRDLPYVWQSGFFQIDADRLRKRLTKAQVVLGDVAETLPRFLEAQELSTVGAVMVDLDYYSSTMSALTAIGSYYTRMLPRSFLYFDDVIGDHYHLYNQFTGELAAIHDFNSTHSDLKVADTPHLAYKTTYEPWMRQVYVLHAFQHPLYAQFIGHDSPQLPLR